MNAPVKSRPTFLRLLQAVVNVAWHANRVIRRNGVLRYLCGMANVWLCIFLHMEATDFLGGPGNLGFPATLILLFVLLAILFMAFRVTFRAFQDLAMSYDRSRARLHELLRSISRNRTPRDD